MRRIIIIGTMLAVLCGSAVALAATGPNTYGGSISVAPTKPGSATHPLAIGWTQTITVKSNQSGKNAAPLKDIKTWLYGLKANTARAATCSSSKIEATGGSGCPSKSLVATGTVQSQLGGSSLTGPTIACDPNLHVYNGGKNYVWYFFIVPNPLACPAKTGSATPYKGTFSRSGKNLVLDVPLPADVSTNAGNTGLYASLTHEKLTWKKIGTGSKGYFTTVGCQAGKRPFKVTYTATTNGTNRYSSTISGKAKC